MEHFPSFFRGGAGIYEQLLCPKTKEAGRRVWVLEPSTEETTGVLGEMLSLKHVCGLMPLGGAGTEASGEQFPVKPGQGRSHQEHAGTQQRHWPVWRRNQGEPVCHRSLERKHRRADHTPVGHFSFLLRVMRDHWEQS